MPGPPSLAGPASEDPQHPLETKLETDPESGLELVYPVDDCPPEIYAEAGLEIHADDSVKGTDVSSRRRKLLWILAVIVCIALIASVASGVTIATRRRSTPERTSASTSGNTSASTSQSDSPIQGLRPGSALAAASYFDTAGYAHHRVYYQDASNRIKESAWDESSKRWTVQTLNQTNAKAGSPLAATAKQPPLDPIVNLYYLDTDDVVQELVWNKQWSTGEGSKANFKAAPSSKLTAAWHQWGEVLGTVVLVYQARNGMLQFANGTENRWQCTTLEADPKEGTGLSIVRFPVPSEKDHLRLYYQRSNGVLTSKEWREYKNATTQRDPSATVYGQWLRETTNLEKIEPAAPLSAFPFYGDNSTNYPEFVQVLSSGSQGITADWWSARNGSLGWRESQHPTVMANVDNYTAVAGHSERKAYAMQDGKISEFMVDRDGVTWISTGDVPTV